MLLKFQTGFSDFAIDLGCARAKLLILITMIPCSPSLFRSSVIIIFDLISKLDLSHFDIMIKT